MKFFLLINVKMPTIVGILTFMSRKNSILGLPESEKSWISWYFDTYEHLKFHAQFSWTWKKFYNLEPRLRFVHLRHMLCHTREKPDKKQPLYHWWKRWLKLSFVVEVSTVLVGSNQKQSFVLQEVACVLSFWRETWQQGSYCREFYSQRRTSIYRGVHHHTKNKHDTMRRSLGRYPLPS